MADTKKIILTVIGYIGIAIVLVATVVAVLLITFLNDDRYSDGSQTIEPVDPANFRYPTSMAGYSEYTNTSTIFQVMFIADNDNNNKDASDKRYTKVHFGLLSKVDGQWTYAPRDSKDITVYSEYTYKGRGVETSEIVQFFDKTYVFDDKTGIASELNVNKKEYYSRMIMADGNGNSENGAKHEWGTVVGNHMYLGSHGRNSTNLDGQQGRWEKYYVFKVNRDMSYTVENWLEVYTRIDALLGITSEGYTTHEAVVYSNMKRKWYFCPRKVSKTNWVESVDNLERAGKYIIEGEENKDNMKFVIDKQYNEKRCFFFVKLFPYNEDIMVYLKTYENGDTVESWIGMTNVKPGEVVMEEVSLGTDKYEGLEIVPLSY
uniref:Apyrase, putative n=1 Tax=Entamoeba invadens TaxID=33085 RepID=S0B584_ENTIV|nr:apyrase precursor, putative [Entamoeba invadens]